MSHLRQNPSPATVLAGGSEPDLSARRIWQAGIRYPSGTEIWCAYRGGEPAWTTDRRLAATYPSEPAAAMAARQLADGDSVPFWITNDR
jgi:hypothetical protein